MGNSVQWRPFPKQLTWRARLGCVTNFGSQPCAISVNLVRWTRFAKAKFSMINSMRGPKLIKLHAVAAILPEHHRHGKICRRSGNVMWDTVRLGGSCCEVPLDFAQQVYCPPQISDLSKI